MNYTWSDLFWIFYIYSFLGWCAGVVANALRRKRFVNTGFLNIPLCPVYGVIGLAYSIFLPELKHHLFFLILGGSIIAFVIILVTSMILEHVFNRKWWDYSKSRFQFQGYLNLIHMVIFGLAGAACIWFVNPFLLNLMNLIPQKIEDIIIIILAVLLVVDTVCCITMILQLHHSVKMRRFMNYVQDVMDDFGNALTRRIQRRMVNAFPNISQEQEVKEEPKEKSSEIFAQGCCFYKLIALFFLGAFLGEITETIFCRITAGVWMSRSSVVYGPFSIVWGLGCAFLTAFLYKYKDKRDSTIFIAGTVLGGAYEYICSVFTELVFGTVFWDYSKIPFNLGGRINLLYCFFWGIAAVVWLKILYPLFSEWIEKIPVKPGKIITWIAIVFMVFNMAVSSLALARYSDRQQNPKADNAVEEFLDDHFDDSRMDRIYPNAKIRN